MLNAEAIDNPVAKRIAALSNPVRSLSMPTLSLSPVPVAQSTFTRSLTLPHITPTSFPITRKIGAEVLKSAQRIQGVLSPKFPPFAIQTGSVAHEIEISTHDYQSNKEILKKRFNDPTPLKIRNGHLFCFCADEKSHPEKYIFGFWVDGNNNALIKPTAFYYKVNFVFSNIVTKLKHFTNFS